MTVSSDEDMIKILENYREQAFRFLEAHAHEPWGDHIEANKKWQVMKAEVEEIMKGHPEFSGGSARYFMGRQIGFWPWMQSFNLLKHAAHSSGASALDWLRKIRGTTVATIDVISEVYGLIVREPIEFSNGVRLVPVGHLLDTPQARVLASKSWPFYQGEIGLLPSAALLTFRDLVGEEDHSAGHKSYLEAIEKIRRTVMALTLSEKNAAVTGLSWIDFHDADLTASGLGSSWHGDTFDGRVSRFPVDVDQAGIEWAERFLALPGEVSAKCEVALTRLNLARRRRTAGDQAIDGCIAFEALLSDAQAGDLTYKLKLRAARLLGNNYAERKAISHKVGNFYSLRGKVVHGQSKGGSTKDHETAKEGLKLALEVLQKVVLEKKIPDIAALELGPINEIDES